MKRRHFMSTITAAVAVNAFSTQVDAQSAEIPWKTEGATHQRTGFNPSISRLQAPLEQSWTFQASAASIGFRTSQVSVGNEYVYACSTDGNLYAIDITTGEEVWRYDLMGQPAGPPTIHNGNVFVAITSGNVFRINASTGEREWAAVAGEHVLGSPSIHGDSLYVTGEYGTDCGTNYCDNWFLRLTAMSINDGSVVWETDMRDNRQSMSPTVGEGVVIATGSRRVVAYNTETHEELWRINEGAAPSAETAIDGTAFVPTESRLIAVRNPNESDAAVEWTFNARGEINGAPVVTSDAVFFKTKQDDLHRIDRESGQQDWVIPLEGITWSELTGVENTIYTGTYEGSVLYAVDMESGDVIMEEDVGVSQPSVVIPGRNRLFIQSGQLHSFIPSSQMTTTQSETSTPQLSPTRENEVTSEVEETTEASGPGFGVASVLAALGLSTYLFRESPKNE